MNKIPDKDLKLLEAISQAIFDKKGFNILTLDIRELSSFADYFIICEGNVEKHVQALGRQVEDVMRERGKKPLHVEGLKDGDWVVLDYSDLVIHLFIPEMREKYALEKLWHNGSIVNIPIHIPA